MIGCFVGHYHGDEEGEDDGKLSGDQHLPGHIPQEGEPDFVETNCHWEDCSKEYETQDELVKVGQSSRRSYHNLITIIKKKSINDMKQK